MHPKFITTCSLAILLLTILGDRHVDGVEFPIEKDENIHNHNHNHVQSHTSTHHMMMDQSTHHMMMDQSTLVFFTLNDLKLGRKLPIYFRGTNPSSSPQFLPREEAKSIPFSLSKLGFLLDFFGFARGSSQAKAMENTLRECTMVKPIKGETKLCATSLESMLDFVHEMLLGGNRRSHVQPLNTKNLEKSSYNVLKNYTIVSEPKEIDAPKMVACHTMPYPYVIYYCHYQKSESKVFQVSLKGETRNQNQNQNNYGVIEAIAVCHMDTSQWSQSHISFQVLGIKPGESPVCHFFPADNLVWVPLYEISNDNVRVDRVSSM